MVERDGHNSTITTTKEIMHHSMILPTPEPKQTAAPTPAAPYTVTTIDVKSDANDALGAHVGEVETHKVITQVGNTTHEVDRTEMKPLAGKAYRLPLALCAPACALHESRTHASRGHHAGWTQGGGFVKTIETADAQQQPRLEELASVPQDVRRPQYLAVSSQRVPYPCAAAAVVPHETLSQWCHTLASSVYPWKYAGRTRGSAILSPLWNTMTGLPSG